MHALFSLWTHFTSHVWCVVDFRVIFYQVNCHLMCLLQLLGVRQQPKLMDSLICTNENQLIMLPYEPPKPCKDATPYGSIRSIGTIFSTKKKNVINKNISNINHEMLRIQILTLSIELYIDTHYLLGQVFFYFFSLTKTQVARERERERTFRLLRKASCINDANPMHSKQ